MPTKRGQAKRARRHLVDATVARRYRERAEKAEARVAELERINLELENDLAEAEASETRLLESVGGVSPG